MTGPSSCPHDGPRDRGVVPLVCSVCGGIEIARAPHSRCARCKGDGHRDPGWETNGPLWRAVVSPHLSGVAHQLAIAPLYLQTPTDAVPPTPTAHSECGGSTARTVTFSPEGAGSHSSVSSHSSSSDHLDERSSVPSRVRGSRAPVAGSRERLAAWSGADRVPCPRCETLVRRDNLSRHLKRCARG